MSKKQLPEVLREFVARQPTIELDKVSTADREDEFSPYGTYYYRAVACVLLSGRVNPKGDDDPNMTDVNRFGKEANFNQYLTERVGKLLVAMDVVRDEQHGCYAAGPHLDAFWDHDVEQLITISRLAVVRIVQRPAQLGYINRQDHRQDRAGLIAFLTLFFACFKDLAIAEPALGQVFRDFAALPTDDLLAGARALGLEVREDPRRDGESPWIRSSSRT
jgi:hypothetical protein